MAVRRRASALSRIVEDPVSRRKFLALSGGSAAAAFLVACGDGDSPESADAVIEERFGNGDIGILNYVLMVEYVSTAFYFEVTHGDFFSGAQLATLEDILEDETQHIEAWVAAVSEAGGKVPKEPKTRFPLTSPRSALELASKIENVGVAAYLGQVRNLRSRQQLAEMLAINSVEGRHAATISTLLGESITPDGAFARPADAETVLGFVEPFIVN